MPKKKVSRKNAKPISKTKVNIRKDVLSSSDSYKSLFYGIATVIVLFILGFSAVRIFISRPKPEIDKEAVSVSKIEQAMKEARENIYTVQKGDSLWNIAEAKYAEGDKWTAIAQANNLQEPFDVEEGQRLVIPVLETPAPEPTIVLETTPADSNPDRIDIQVTPEVTGTPEESNIQTQEPSITQEPVVSTDEKITGTTYKIVHGDDLWEIAVRAYGDGYRWVDIAHANGLDNPDLIHSDNILAIPRP